MSPPGTFPATTREPSDAVQADPLLVWSERKQRYYRRKFDFDEARTLYARGFTIGRLALRYGVHSNAIRRVVVPGEADRQNEIHKRWRTTVCESCGGSAMTITGGKAAHNPDGRILCHACRGRVRRKPIRYGDGVIKVECGACQTWKSLEEFPPRVTRSLAAGARVRARCRVCEGAHRRRYRETHKVPCERCRQPCLPPNEKGARAAHRALCAACYQASDEKKAALAKGSATHRHRAAERRARELEAASPRKGSEA